MSGVIWYFIFIAVGAVMCVGGAHAADTRDYMHNGYWPEGGMRNVFIGCAVVGAAMVVVGIIALFCIVTASEMAS